MDLQTSKVQLYYYFSNQPLRIIIIKYVLQGICNIWLWELLSHHYQIIY